MITMESCEKEVTGDWWLVTGVKLTTEFKPHNQHTVFVSLEESFRPKFDHQRPQKTTIQILALEGKAALRKKLGLDWPALTGITNPFKIQIRSP